MIRKIVVFGLFLTCSFTFAQSTPAAEGRHLSLWAGVEGSTFNPDWGCTSENPFTCWDHQLQGIAVFSDLNHIIGKVGVEGEARWLIWRGPGQGIKQSNYLGGPRYQVLGGRKYAVDVKFLAGGATFHLNNMWGGWSAFVPGITGAYRLTPKLLLRADYEYQMWPGFVGGPGHAHGLTPNGFSVGVSYRILH